ncbi:MAG: DUF4012 domain-containing protein [Candidatus Levybacteria bacterium]|nr:DUF4012 domain-containing protein [Candidatus Levybacteria bacterium]
MKPALFSAKYSPNIILIIDKVGLIGERLALKLSSEFRVVLVSKKLLENYEKKNENIIHVPFLKKFPSIPDNKYSKIVLIDQKGLCLDFLPTLIKKANNTNSDFILALGLFSTVRNQISITLSLSSAAKVVLLGDVFDNRLIFKDKDLKSSISDFIYSAQKFGRMQVVGEGLGRAYTVFVDDAVSKLRDILEGKSSSSSLFYIFPKHTVSELTLAHMIQKNNPEITIDFTKPIGDKETISYPLHGKYLLEDKYPLASKIKKINIKNAVIISENKVTKRKIKRVKYFSFFVWVLALLLFAPLVFTLFFSLLGLGTLNYARGNLEKGKIAQAKSSLHLSQTFFYIGKKTSDVLLFQGRIVGRENSLKRFSDDIDLGYKISKGTSQVFNALDYFVKVFSGESQDPINNVIIGKNDLKSAIMMLEKIKAEGKVPVFLMEKIERIDPLIKFLSNTLDFLPSILVEGQKTYLVLFQNSMELRPGGGLIDSYGILKLNKGKITDFSIHDVYDADGQLRGHVEPPFAIRRYLPSVHLYLRDSNFEIDFVKSASLASNILNAETGEKVAGVIAIDTSFIKNILRVIGPVNVPDYKEIITADNFFELTQKHTEKDFFPGSTQKKDFLRSLYGAMQTKFVSGNVSYFPLIQAISDSLVQKHLILTVNNDLQNILAVNGWSSSLLDKRKDDPLIINDFLGINEANLGANKANFFIKRKLSQRLTLAEEGTVEESVSISYFNSSIPNKWPGGDYKNYLRIIAPKNSLLSEILVDGERQMIVPAITDPETYEKKGFLPPQGLEVETAYESNKNIYGFLVIVPAGKLKTITVKYNFQNGISENQSSFNYSHKLFKQSGTEDYPFEFSLTYPKTYKIISRPEELKVEGHIVSFSKNISRDEEFSLDFAAR